MKFKIAAHGLSTHRLNIFTLVIAATTIFSMIIPILIVDVSLFFYQIIYFGLMGIPKIKRNDFVGIDRWDLSKLNLVQKISCVYCDYANGVIDYARAVSRQTELYNCAIKYSHAKKNTDDRQQYYEQDKFK